MSSRIYEVLNEPESSVDAAELAELVEDAAKEPSNILQQKSPSPVQLNSMCNDPKPRAFYDPVQRLWTIRAYGAVLCTVANQALEGAQLFKLYTAANDELIESRRINSEIHAKINTLGPLCTKLELEVMYYKERSEHLELQRKCADEQMAREVQAHKALEQKYQSYKEATKTIINHLKQQNKKGKKETH